MLEGAWASPAFPALILAYREHLLRSYQDRAASRAARLFPTKRQEAIRLHKEDYPLPQFKPSALFHRHRLRQRRQIWQHAVIALAARGEILMRSLTYSIKTHLRRP